MSLYVVSGQMQAGKQKSKGKVNPVFVTLSQKWRSISDWVSAEDSKILLLFIALFKACWLF